MIHYGVNDVGLNTHGNIVEDNSIDGPRVWYLTNDSPGLWTESAPQIYDSSGYNTE